MTETTDDSDETATVSEDKFNGTATVEVRVPEGTERRAVESCARKFFKDTHGTSPSKVVAEKERMSLGDGDRWTVMLSDHSSGSLVDTEHYDL